MKRGETYPIEPALFRCLPLLFCATYESSDLAKRTSVVFVDDDHALTQPTTMNLISKAMVDFFELDCERKQGQEVHESGKIVEVRRPDLQFTRSVIV